MTCETCKVDAKRFGVNRNGTLRFRCPKCRKTFSEPRKSLLGNMTVTTEKALMILNLFIEGTSVRSTERLTGVHRDTILKVLVAAGAKCEKLLGSLIVNIPVSDVGDRVSFAQLIKVYGTTEDGREARYSPSEIVETEVVPVFGDPDAARICTSIVECQNLTIRM